MASNKPAKDDWDATVSSLELGLLALGLPVPLSAIKKVVDMIQRHWTQDGAIQAELDHNAALKIIEEAIEPLAGAALGHADDLDELKRGQDQMVTLLLRVLRERETSGAVAANTAVPLFEGPRQAPARVVTHFKGRDAELAKLEQLLVGDDSMRCVVAAGIGGIGKTTLALQFVARRASKLFPAGVAWLDGGQLVAELGRVSRRFGWTDEHAPTPAEAISLLGTTLYSKPVLLVVDNFDPKHGDPKHVPAPGGRCRTLVTSRARTVNIQLDVAALELGVWTIEVCREYLRERCPRLGGVADAEINALAEFVGRLPLGVRLLVSVLSRRRSLSPAALLKLLEAQPLPVLDKYDADLGIAATFQFSYDDLSQGERRALQALAVCAKQTRAEIVEVVAGALAGDVREMLDDLHERGLAEFAAEAGAPWGLHEVVQMFVLGQPGRHVFETAHTGWVRTHFEQHAEGAAWEGFSTGVDEAQRALERLLGGSFEELVAIFRPLADHLRAVGRYPEAIALGELLLGTTPVHPAKTVLAMSNLGLCYRILGDPPKALDFFERTLDIQEKFGRPLGGQENLGLLDDQAATLGNLGTCYQALGDITTAICFHERALAINEQLDRPEDQAQNLGNLGCCYRTLGNTIEALDFFKRALAINEQFDLAEGQVNDLCNLGLCHRTLGDITTAIDFHEHSLAISKRLGLCAAQATNLCNLGLCYRTRDTPKAIDYHERSLTISEQLGLRAGQANNLAGLGLCQVALNDTLGAIDLVERALAINEELGLAEEQASNLGLLGACYQQQGEMTKAIDFVERALAINEERGYLAGQAASRMVLGFIAAKCASPEQAREQFTRTLELYRTMGMPDDHELVEMVTQARTALD